MQHRVRILTARLVPRPPVGLGRGRTYLVAALLGGAAGLAGCGPPPEKKLGNPDPSGKIPAIKRVARAKDLRAAPQLVKELESDDPAVRFYAIQALRRMTGEEFGYRYFDDDEAQRQPAIDRWRAWLEQQGIRVKSEG